MPQLLAFSILAFILWVGDIVSVRTRSWLPSVFICALLFLFGYWTFFPQDIVEIAGFQTPIVYLAMYLLITNMGSLLSFAELTRQWRTVVIALSGIVGIIILLFTAGLLVLDYQTIVIATPPLVGGIVASLIMSQAATDAGLQALSVLAILVYVMQGFAGYPLTAIMLKREGRRVLIAHRKGEWQAVTRADTTVVDAGGPRLFKAFPAGYQTPYFAFMRLGIVAFAAWGSAQLLSPVVTISPFVLCLVFGVIATTLGFLEREPLRKANGFGLTVLILMVFIFDGLKRATPDMLTQLAVPLVTIVVIGLIGMYLASFLTGRLLGVSPAMAFACSLTALYGFPADYIITNDVIRALSDDEDERALLTDHLLPPMLVAGFVTVTMVSVVLAGLFVGLIA
ncbi:hypothetical protein [Paracoccus sp. JM45]|uniref:hypothetical protein n=1 Tax=Paracoccus sp. JM45 TaxID=2283626 RepID=UPI000E6D5A64|nr:hypothetical protein [Paracoccus sp. JM45]RJE81431.1 hypothetical protein DWB67_01950 [Paracoccus sp. JM45]